jgi:thioredoxin-related protein
MKSNIWAVTALIALVAITGCSKKPGQEAAGSQAQSGTSASGTEVSAEWITDFEAAKQKAAAEGKDLLIDFSGSDWCYWCKKLDGEVFSKAEFINEAGRHYVFVMIDFPRDKSGQSSQLQAQNKQLAEQFKIQGYPTVILAKADGTQYAQTGYQEGGPEAYLAHLKELREKQ